MDPERWQRLSPLLDALLELEPEERDRRVDSLRGEDPALADDLAALIALEDRNADFMAEPLVTPPATSRAGAEVGPYRLERMIGEGGMGQVWLAARADGLYQRRVALKLLRAGFADTNLRLRFTREREILARLAHPHIARLLDAGVSREGLPYLALEYVDGVPITDYCRDHHTPPAARLRMFQQICGAVSHAHANLIVHRDLKPSNILVTPAGDVRLLDFGIAKLLDHEAPVIERTRTGARAFTLHYAAPEQVRGEPVTTMTDVYSLGVVLYELLADTKPYLPARASDAAWEEAILTADPVRPSQALQRVADAQPDNATVLRRRARLLVGDLDNIVLKTLSKRPELRYPSIEALAQDLHRHESGRPVLARPHGVGYRVRKYVLRHRWALATGTAVAVVLTAALGIVAWQAREAVREAARAQAIQDFMLSVFENASVARDGKAIDLRELLNAALERGKRELARQPRAQAELIGVVARLRIGLGDYREARTLLERQAGIVDGDAGIPDGLRLESLTQRGRVLRLLGEPRACIDLMQPQLATARRYQAQLPPQVTEFYSQLGRCRRANGERQGARQLFERSLSLRRDNPSDRVGMVENLMDLANLRADVGESRAALRELAVARAQLLEEAGNRHPLLIDIDRSLGNLHRAHGATVAAERSVRSALTVSSEVNGEGHPATIATRQQLAQLLAESGRYAPAREELREANRHLATRFGAHHPGLVAGQVELGWMEWQLGDGRAAVTTLQRALTLARRGGDPDVTATALSRLAAVLQANGRAGEALPLLQEAERLQRQRWGDDHALVGDTLRQIGETQWALGDTDAGLATLQRAFALTRAGYGPSHAHTRQAELALARAQTLRGDASALPRLDALASLSLERPTLRPIALRAGAYAAAARCHGSEHARATTALAALAGPLEQYQPSGGALSRELAAIAAGCR